MFIKGLIKISYRCTYETRVLEGVHNHLEYCTVATFYFERLCIYYVDLRPKPNIWYRKRKLEPLYSEVVF